MKVPPLNLIKQLLKKKVFFYPQKYLSKKKFFINLFLIFLLAFFTYFLKPTYYDYNNNKDIIQNKIKDKFKLQTIIEGDISYSAFPSPSLIVNNIKINFGNINSNKIIIKKMIIKTAFNKIFKINELDFKKIILIDQSIKINPSNLKQIFNFLTLHKEGQITLKNTNVIFEDTQKNKINFDKVNLIDKFKNNKHKITSHLYFSNNQIKIKFENFIGSEKLLKINIPNLNQNLEVNFNKESTLKNLVGQLKLNIFDSILLLNFEGKDNFNISKSYLRNEFFRYHEYQIWDRFIIHQLNVLEAFGNGDDSELIKNSMARFVDNWGRISAIAGLLSDPVCKKQLTTIVENCIGLSNLFLETNFNPAVKELLLRQRELHTVSEYDFCIAYA